MGALVIKIFMNIIEFLLRPLVFNRKLPGDYSAVIDIPYSSTGKMDIYLPADIKGKLPVLIYLHGGGWTTGSKKTSKRQCVTIAREGFLVLNIKYRLGPRHKHPKQLEDIGNVLKWLNENDDNLNANLNRIFFGGSSAGAHLSCLSACLATKDELRESIGVEFPVNREQIAGIVLLYGGYNLESVIYSGFFMIRTLVKSYTGTKNPSGYEYKHQISPVHHITDDFPPAYITAGERDKLFGQALELIEVLEKNGRPYEKLLFDKSVKNAKHAFINFHYRDCAKQAYDGIIGFLKKYSE